MPFVGGAYITMDASGALSGVAVNGGRPVLHTLTSAGNVQTLLGTGIENTRAYYKYDEGGQLVLNPAILSEKVTICSGEVYLSVSSRFSVPAWCESSPVIQVDMCPVAFATECGQLSIDVKHVWSWSDDGVLLYKRSSPDPVPGAISVSIAIAILAAIETASTWTNAPRWLLMDVAGFALITAIFMAKSPYEMIVHGISFGTCFFFRVFKSSKTRADFSHSLAIRQVVAPSVAIAVSSLIPVNAVGVSPRRLLESIVAASIAVTSGARGTLWTIPWLIFDGLLSIVEQSAAIDVRSEQKTYAIVALFTFSLFIIGVSAASDAPWWKLMGNIILRVYKRRTNGINDKEGIEWAKDADDSRLWGNMVPSSSVPEKVPFASSQLTL